jgi:ABC-2 type transport system ATP-binding protein
MDETVISTTGLTKYYGKQRGIVDLSLQVRRGEVSGYLGPNGAGKTTTIRTLLDLIRPTSGHATVLGLDTRRESVAIRRRVGFLPGELGLYPNMTGAQTEQYAAHLRGGVDDAYVGYLAQTLQADLSRQLKQLSHGNKQKIGLVLALMNRPELVILDEPTQGLDPLVQQAFYRLVEEAKADGRTVFLSSHVLPEVERTCDRVAIIRDGRLVAVEEVAELKRRALRELEITFSAPVPPQSFTGLPGVRDVQVADSTLRCKVVGSLDAVVKQAAGFEVLNVVSYEPSLEEIFLAYYGGGESDAA